MTDQEGCVNFVIESFDDTIERDITSLKDRRTSHPKPAAGELTSVGRHLVDSKCRAMCDNLTNTPESESQSSLVECVSSHCGSSSLRNLKWRVFT